MIIGVVGRGGYDVEELLYGGAGFFSDVPHRFVRKKRFNCSSR